MDPSSARETERGTDITGELVKEVLQEELELIKQTVGENEFRFGKYEEAAELFSSLTLQDDFVEFLTLPGYEKVDRNKNYRNGGDYYANK